MPEPISFLAAAAPSLIQAGGNVAGGLIGQKRAYKYNKRLAAFQHQKNMEILKYQLDYNTPAAQMQRFRDAGLNENLIYGQGDAGNWSGGRPEYPTVQAPDFSFLANLGTQVAQARLMDSQADLTEQKVEESGVKQDLMRSQKALTDSNPYLEPGYVEAMVTQLKAAADIKKSEASWFTEKQWMQSVKGNEATMEYTSNGFRKMDAQLNQLIQRFKLNEQDSKVKAEIIKGKEFDNALREIQVNWMKDGDITPQHIYQGIMMLLMKLR